MPLSKKRNRDRMRLIRLHKAISTPQDIKPVQPAEYVVIGGVRYKKYVDGQLEG